MIGWHFSGFVFRFCSLLQKVISPATIEFKNSTSLFNPFYLTIYTSSKHMLPTLPRTAYFNYHYCGVPLRLMFVRSTFTKGRSLSFRQSWGFGLAMNQPKASEFKILCSVYSFKNRSEEQGYKSPSYEWPICFLPSANLCNSPATLAAWPATYPELSSFPPPSLCLMALMNISK